MPHKVKVSKPAKEAARNRLLKHPLASADLPTITAYIKANVTANSSVKAALIILAQLIGPKRPGIAQLPINPGLTNIQEK
jgi:hypothetical protein